MLDRSPERGAVLVTLKASLTVAAMVLGTVEVAVRQALADHGRSICAAQFRGANTPLADGARRVAVVDADSGELNLGLHFGLDASIRARHPSEARWRVSVRRHMAEYGVVHNPLDGRRIGRSWREFVTLTAVDRGGRESPRRIVLNAVVPPSARLVEGDCRSSVAHGRLARELGELAAVVAVGEDRAATPTAR